ncbi:hypothetical protein ACWGID_11225 [Kribbella sp. NPDC054772]
MEHPSGTTPYAPAGSVATAASAASAGSGAPVAAVAAVASVAPVDERQARADWLITELGRLAADADDPHDQARFRRTADSLVRLAIAFRS